MPWVVQHYHCIFLPWSKKKSQSLAGTTSPYVWWSSRPAPPSPGRCLIQALLYWYKWQGVSCDISKKGRHRPQAAPAPNSCKQSPVSFLLVEHDSNMTHWVRRKKKGAWLGIEPRTTSKSYTQRVSWRRIILLDHQALLNTWYFIMEETISTWKACMNQTFPHRRCCCRRCPQRCWRF